MSDEKKADKEKLFNVALSTFEETMEFRMKHYGWRHPLVALNWQEKVSSQYIPNLLLSVSDFFCI